MRGTALQDFLIYGKMCLAEVVECYCISGGSDFLLKVLMKDMDEYRHFILHKLATLPNIGNAQSRFVVNEIKSQTPVPIEI